ncbi:MAG TPA: hypothetical protein ENK28_04630 [Aliiroseovarius sp.]|nr:hypothetical protein [Aliiroseovarius sp.]
MALVNVTGILRDASGVALADTPVEIRRKSKIVGLGARTIVPAVIRLATDGAGAIATSLEIGTYEIHTLQPGQRIRGTLTIPTGVTDITIAEALEQAPEDIVLAASDARDAADEAAASAKKAVAAREQTQRLMAKLAIDSEDCNIVVAGDSTGNAPNEWVFLLAMLIAADWPIWNVRYRVWDDTTASWLGESVIKNGSGTNKLTVWNASIPGAVWDRFAGEKLSPVFLTPAPDLIMWSYGHNGTTNPDRQGNLAEAMTGQVARALPEVPQVIVGQNARLDNDTMTKKVDVFRAIAAQNGFGFVDVNQAFLTSPDHAALMADDVHPNDAGSALWAATVHNIFQVSPDASGVGQSVFSGFPLYTARAYKDFSDWVLNGNATMAVDLVNYETKSEGVEISNSAGSPGYITYNVVDSSDIRAHQEQWVTFCVRSRIDSSQPVTAGRIALYDGVSTTAHSGNGPQGDGFYWQIISHKVDPAAGYVRAYIYANSGSEAAVHTVDRCAAFAGKVGRDFAENPVVDRYGNLYLFGDDSTGLLHARNGSDGSRAMVFYSTLNGTDEDTVSQRTLSIGGDYIMCKGRSDTYERLRIEIQTGRLKFGSSSGNPLLSFHAGSPSRLIFSGGSMEPQATGVQDLGINNRHWRTFFGEEIRLGGNAGVLQAYGAGSPEGLLAANPGSTFQRTDGGAGTCFYVKESGTGTTGWVAK